MAYWVSCSPERRLQDVQAGVNVIIAFLCAGGIFVLVRHFWMSAARKVLQQRDVPAYSLLSLGTMGEAIDIMWLLRRDLVVSSRYRGLLVQCLGVLVLTVASLLSGVIARFSTQNGVTTMRLAVKGNLAERSLLDIIPTDAIINRTFAAIDQSHFPRTQLLEFWPTPGSDWQYNPNQWNGSWTMDCEYEGRTEIPDLVVTNNCSDGLTSKLPQLLNNWDDWNTNESDLAWAWTVSTDYVSMARDWVVFAHSVEVTDVKDDFCVGLRVRTVAYYLTEINATTSDDCILGPGPVTNASFTSFTCMLHRALGNRSTEDLQRWGANPDAIDVSMQVQAYSEFYAPRFQEESMQGLPATTINGEELAQLYQAYMISKPLK